MTSPAVSPRPRHGAPPTRASARRRRRRGPVSRLVGGLGEILITLGVLGLLFVVWELWWTGIEAESDRNDSLDEFYAQMPHDTGTTEVGGDDADPDDFETCYTLEDGTDIGCAPVMAERAEQNEVMATIYAPRLGDDWAAPVREGVAAEQIDRGGVGRYTNTELPDEPGNFALAGHRNTHSSMLGRQDDLEMGDRIYLVSPDGMYTFEVSERQVVDPSATEVLNPVPGEPDADPDAGVLTFTTCHPMYSNAERLIHHAEIVDFTPPGGEAADELTHLEPIQEMFYAGGAD